MVPRLVGNCTAMFESEGISVHQSAVSNLSDVMCISKVLCNYARFSVRALIKSSNMAHSFSKVSVFSTLHTTSQRFDQKLFENRRCPQCVSCTSLLVWRNNKLVVTQFVCFIKYFCLLCEMDLRKSLWSVTCWCGASGQ